MFVRQYFKKSINTGIAGWNEGTNRKYLKQNHKVIYYNYLTSGKLYEHLSKVDSRAETMFNDLVKSLAEKENITEDLKKSDAIKWIFQRMNNICERVREIVNKEIVFR